MSTNNIITNLYTNINKNNKNTEIKKREMITRTRQSTRQRTGWLGLLINSKFGTGKRHNTKKLITHVINSNIKSSDKLILGNLIGRGTYANVYKLKVGDRELIYKSITNINMD
jgi:hypothetical protein